MHSYMEVLPKLKCILLTFNTFLKPLFIIYSIKHFSYYHGADFVFLSEQACNIHSIILWEAETLINYYEI